MEMGRDKEKILTAVRYFILENYKRPTYYRLYRGWFTQQSYSYWAAYELLSYLRKNPHKDPYIAVHDFRDIFNEARCLNKPNGYMYEMAYDVATDVIDMLDSMLNLR